jgi:hypothetical protein
MLLGILSDSHGRHERTARAVRILRGYGAEAFIHCGDIGTRLVLDALAGLNAWFVWGNNDVADDPFLNQYVTALGLPLPPEPPLRVRLAGRSLAVLHGHEPDFARLVDALRAGRGDQVAELVDDAQFVLYGHTHVAADEQVGTVRLINPGALHRARQYTVALLDLESDKLISVPLPEVDGTAPYLR